MNSNSKEALEKLRRLAVNSESDLSNCAISREYTAIIEKELKFLEILKDKFYIKFETHDWGSYINIVGKKDYDENDGIDCIAGSDFLNDEETKFLKEYLKEENK